MSNFQTDKQANQLTPHTKDNIHHQEKIDQIDIKAIIKLKEI